MEASRVVENCCHGDRLIYHFNSAMTTPDDDCHRSNVLESRRVMPRSSSSKGCLFTNFEDVQLTDEERVYLNAAALGDVPILRQSLEEEVGGGGGGTDVPLNVNCVDYMGRSALHLAVDNENMESIDLLLDRLEFECIEESLLHAISKGSTKIVRAIIEHPNYIAGEDSLRMRQKDPFFRTDEKSQFSPDITPLILAAHYNNHEIIQMFLSRNHTIEKPHHISCRCSECVTKRNYDSLKRSRSRLNAYRALASPAYMALSSPDPIMTTFELRQEMKKLAQVEKEFKSEYLGLVEQCMDFACELMDLCRGTQEVEAVLSEGGTGSGSRDPLARLKMAMEYEEKKFVAHPNCQQHLTSIWYGSETGFMQSLPLWKKMIMWLVCVPLVPLFCLVYIIAPNNKIGNALRCPASKFITHTLSHLCFLILLAAATFRLGERFLPIPTARTSAVDWFENMSLGHFDQSTTKYDDDVARTERVESFLKGTFRPANILITNVQICLMFWVLGLLWMECKQMYNSGVRVYFLDNYNWIDFIVLSLYLSSYTLRFLVDHWIKSADNFYNAGTERARRALVTKNYTLYDTIEHEIFTDPVRHDKSYFMQALRFEWKPNDPEIVSDVLFAVANVLSIARTTYLMPAFEVLGPLQISLGRMIGDITRFLVLFTLVLLAFMVGIHNLYWYYGSQIYYVVKDGNRKLTHSSEAFQGMPRTLLSLFWSMFGLVSVESVEIKYPKKERGDKFLSSFPGGNHATSIVEGVGQFLFALYHVAIIIVLTNMLIAMMSHSFEAIQGDCDVEWKFARTRLWVNYIDEGSTLPVPFNMIPTPKSLLYIWLWIKELFRRKDKDVENINDSAKRQTFIKSRREMVCQSLSLDSPETNYSDILQRLVRRYLFKLERQKEEGKDKAGIGSDGQTLQGQPSPEIFNQPEPAFADDTDDQDSNNYTSPYQFPRGDDDNNRTTQSGSNYRRQPSNPPRYENVQPRLYESKGAQKEAPGKMNVGFNIPEAEEKWKEDERGRHQTAPYAQNSSSRAFKSAVVSRSRYASHSQYRNSRRPSLLPGSCATSGGGGPGSSAAVVQLISLPQIDAIQRSLKLLDVRLQHVQSAAREENHSRKDIDHIRTVMSENQKALSTVVTVLSSIQEEVRSLSVAFSKQQQLQIVPPLTRKRSNETKQPHFHHHHLYQQQQQQQQQQLQQQQQMTSSSSSTKLLSSPAPISPSASYFGNPFSPSSPVSPTQTPLSVTSTSGCAMIPRELRKLGTRTENSFL